MWVWIRGDFVGATAPVARNRANEKRWLNSIERVDYMVTVFLFVIIFDIIMIICAGRTF